MDTARDVLIQRMEREGINQSELAARMGITRSHVSRLLSGERPVTVKLARRLRTEFPELLLIVVRTLTDGDLDGSPGGIRAAS